MLDLNKNSDYLWLQTGHKQGEYYDLNSEGWRSFIVDNLIEWKITA